MFEDAGNVIQKVWFSLGKTILSVKNRAQNRLLEILDFPAQVSTLQQFCVFEGTTNSMVYGRMSIASFTDIVVFPVENTHFHMAAYRYSKLEISQEWIQKPCSGLIKPLLRPFYAF